MFSPLGGKVGSLIKFLNISLNRRAAKLKQLSQPWYDSALMKAMFFFKYIFSVSSSAAAAAASSRVSSPGMNCLHVQ